MAIINPYYFYFFHICLSLIVHRQNIYSVLLLSLAALFIPLPWLQNLKHISDESYKRGAW